MAYSHTEHLKRRADFTGDFERLIQNFEGDIDREILAADAESVFAAYRPDGPSHDEIHREEGLS